MADTSIETVPMAAHEAQAERYTRIIVFTAIGWAVSVLLLSIILMFAISTEIEAVEEIVTTETTDVAQHTGDSGSNYFAGGDMSNGNANGSAGQDNEDGKGNAD